MKGTNRSLDFLRGSEEIDISKKRVTRVKFNFAKELNFAKGEHKEPRCPICFEALLKYLEDEIEGDEKNDR